MSESFSAQEYKASHEHKSGRLFGLLNQEKLSVPELLEVLKQSTDQEHLFDGIGAADIPLEVHTRRVLGQFEKYLATSETLKNFDRGFLRLFLALHDLGKPKSIVEESPEKEHAYTWEQMSKILDDLSVEKDKKLLAQALLSDDPIGECFQGKISPKKAAENLQVMADMAGISPQDMLVLTTIYFQSDAGSYTEDSGGSKRLDHLFVFNPKEHLISFASEQATKMDEIKAEINNL